MAVIPALAAIPGLNVFFWGIVSIIRGFSESLVSKNPSDAEKQLLQFMEKNSVAVCIAARNEEQSIEVTLKSICKIIPKKNIFVASDGSTDKTYQIAKKLGVRVIENNPNIGKAKSLVKLIEFFSLTDKFQFIFFVDADIVVNENFVKRALPQFADPDVSAVTGHAKINWKGIKYFSMETFIKSYRLRLYTILQYTIRFGQTSKLLNASPVAPGFAVIYRSSVLKKINLATEGLIIEDFNTAFQIYKKRLGKIYYHPEIWAYGCEPVNLPDYISQVNRWNLGFWQTLFKHKIWASLFSTATLIFLVESFLIALFIYSLPVTTFMILIEHFPDLFTQGLVSISKTFNKYLGPEILFTTVILLDYLITLIIAVIFKKPILLLYGIFFILFRFLDSVIIISSMIEALFKKSASGWISPKRKIVSV